MVWAAFGDAHSGVRAHNSSPPAADRSQYRSGSLFRPEAADFPANDAAVPRGNLSGMRVVAAARTQDDDINIIVFVVISRIIPILKFNKHA